MVPLPATSATAPQPAWPVNAAGVALRSLSDLTSIKPTVTCVPASKRTLPALVRTVALAAMVTAPADASNWMVWLASNVLTTISVEPLPKMSSPAAKILNEPLVDSILSFRVTSLPAPWASINKLPEVPCNRILPWPVKLPLPSVITASLPIPDKLSPLLRISSAVLSARNKPPLTVLVAVKPPICEVNALVAVPIPDSAAKRTVAVSPARLCVPL